MGNVIGVDFSYTSKMLLDRVYIAVIWDSDKVSSQLEEIVAQKPFLVPFMTQLTPHRRGCQLRLFYVLANDVETAVHFLGQYRSIVQKVALCGNPSTSLLTTLQSLMPDTVIYQFEHETCLRFGETLYTSQGNVLDLKNITGALEPTDSSTLQDHLHVSVHSDVSYHIRTTNCNESRLLGSSPVGCSAVVALFNKFLARHETERNDLPVYLPMILDFASQGSTETCDMLVSHIYGGACEHMGLPGDLVASSFGALQRLMKSRQAAQVKDLSNNHDNSHQQRPKSMTASNEKVSAEDPGYRVHCNDVNASNDRMPTPLSPSQNIPPKEDFACSLINMLIINTTQHAALHAKAHGLKSVVFSGMVFEDVAVCSLVQNFMDYWSEGTMISHVCRNPMYIAALGASELAISQISQ
ncbi:hypothetical protein X943_000707 [Babesia divergens]|uniref:Pantothenate kinase n=1 Tax=Babesia divergens TaxID=32595 RepID=A0AAD9GCP4_BABDI|nr:hypothetical protein X943_000707 [Babesia divergens]